MQCCIYNFSLIKPVFCLLYKAKICRLKMLILQRFYTFYPNLILISYPDNHEYYLDHGTYITYGNSYHVAHA